MTKSFLITAAVILTAPAAWAQVQNAGPDGSTGGNSVGAALTAPAAPSASTGGGASAGVSTQVQNAGPDGSTGGNSVGAAVAAPATPSARSNASVAHPGMSHQ